MLFFDESRLHYIFFNPSWLVEVVSWCQCCCVFWFVLVFCVFFFGGGEVVVFVFFDRESCFFKHSIQLCIKIQKGLESTHFDHGLDEGLCLFLHGLKGSQMCMPYMPRKHRPPP